MEQKKTWVLTYRSTEGEKQTELFFGYTQPELEWEIDTLAGEGKLQSYTYYAR